MSKQSAADPSDVRKAIEESVVIDDKTLAVIVDCIEKADARAQESGLPWGWFVKFFYDALIEARAAHEPAPVLLSQERHAIWVTLQTCIERSVPLDPTAKKLLMQLYDRATVPPDVRSLLSACVDSLAGYRRERNEAQQCDAEKAARAFLTNGTGL
jgi:hypothetical protein